MRQIWRTHSHPYNIPASTADAAAINPNGIKTLLANDLRIFFIKGKSVFSIGSRNMPRNPPDCTISGSWIFGSFILADKLYAKA